MIRLKWLLNRLVCHGIPSEAVELEEPNVNKVESGVRLRYQYKALTQERKRKS